MLLQDYLPAAAEKFPGKKAVIINRTYITYRDLDIQSNCLANFLAARQVKPGTNVGIYLNKSIEAVVSIMGILKAGCVYIPLDPDSPAERISYIVKSSHIKHLVTDNAKIRKMARNSTLFAADLTLINMHELPLSCSGIPLGWKVIEKQFVLDSPAEYRPVDMEAGSLAYILYTSGSTGYPKGVMLTHNNATAFTEWAADYFHLTAMDIFSSHAPFHFDLSIFDIFTCLKCGGTLCLVPGGMGYFPDALLDYIQSNKITVWYSVPSAIIQFLNFPGDLKEKLASLSQLIYAGEVFPYKYLNRINTFLTNCAIYNLYGPTETNVITYYRVAFPPSGELIKDVPIGKACPYARLLIVDEQGQPVASGQTGELVVNGASLMQGYWQDNGKTASVIKQLTLDNKQESFYFTGDLVSENESGELIYAGRRDSMLKIRGFRVELGEIEAVLYKNGKIGTAAVIAVPDEKTGNRIIAFIRQEENENITVNMLVDYLARYLPVYMIPGEFIFLSDFPLTSTGKIDKQELKKKYQDTIPG